MRLKVNRKARTQRGLGAKKLSQFAYKPDCNQSLPTVYNTTKYGLDHISIAELIQSFSYAHLNPHALSP
jgi:hypothetical protein